MLTVKTRGRCDWVFFQWLNKATCYAVPQDTAAAQLFSLASKTTGTYVGHASAFPVLPASAALRNPFPSKSASLPPHIALNQSSTEAR